MHGLLCRRNSVILSRTFFVYEADGFFVFCMAIWYTVDDIKIFIVIMLKIAARVFLLIVSQKEL